MRLIEFENKLNKTIDEISITLNAKLTKYKTDNIDVIESKIIDSIKYLKNMNARIIANQESIKELSLMLESHVGVDPVNLLDFDVKEALSINVNGEEDNAGGPSYLIFDNQKMSKKDAIVTFTAKYDIKVYGIFIGMGGNGGRGYLRGQDHNHPVAYGGNGSGGQDGVRYTFNLKKGEKFYVQFQSKGYSILKTPEKEIKLRQGSSSRGGLGGGHNSYGQPGKNSSGPDVSDIIKTHKKKDNTLIFSSLPKKFGGGGAGGYGGWWHNDRFGKSGYYGIGGGSRGRSNQMSAQRAIRNYGAGGGAHSSISGNPRPGQLIYSGPGGQGGPNLIQQKDKYLKKKISKIIIQEVEEIFLEKSLKCGSHKKILSDIRLFDQETDIDTLKSIKFLNQGIELAFELSIKNDLIIYLPQFYPFKIPEIYILDLDKEKRIQLKEFVNKKKTKKIIKIDQFSKLNEMFIQDIPSINLVEILEEVMTILKPYKLGWFSNK